MGEQLFIIGATGSANPDLVKNLMAVLMAAGLQVRHASRRYQGTTTFETGGPHDLQLELGGVASTSEPATLETVLAELRGHREEFRAACNGTKPPAAETEEGPQKGAKKRKKGAEEGGKNAPVTTELPAVETLPVVPPVEDLPVGEEHTTEEETPQAEPTPEPEAAPPAEG